MKPGRIASDPAAGSDCPGRERIASFVDGALSAEQEDSLRAHIDVCASCRRLVAGIGAGGTGSVPVAEEAPRTREAERDGVIAAGAVIGGKYRVTRLLGTGGMGKVFAALHVDLGHTLAVKIMHPEMAHDADLVKRFMREGRAAALLKSDHAARINDVGRLPSGVPFLVMEYLEGEDLDRRSKRAPLSIDEVVDYMLQALAAIAEAHGAGLVHRDIKPQNLFLARLPDGRVRVKVLDFGLAKELATLHRSTSALTTDNMILGSPHFMSPEQIRSPMNVDGRTDIWAVGATMFMLLTGRHPFTSSTVHGLLARILADPAPSARDLRGDIPVALDALLERCMAKDVTARFQTVTELSAALRELSTGEGSLASTRAAPAPAPATIPETPAFTLAGADPDDVLASTRVRAISSPAIPTRSPPQTAPPTMLAAGAVPETVPLPTERTGVPSTVPMGTVPMTPALAATMPSPAVHADVPRPQRHALTLRSEPIRYPPSVASDEPVGPAAPLPKVAASRRVATVALMVVTLAAGVVVVLAIRAARAQETKLTSAPHGDVRAIEPVGSSGMQPSETPAASGSVAAGSVAAATSAGSAGSAVSAPSAAPAASSSAIVGTTAPTSSTPTTVKKPPRTVVPSGTAAATATKDPYSWGK